MRFVRYTFNDESTISFCLDDVVTFESHNERDTLITLRNQREILLDIEEEEFLAEVFSDIAYNQEYQVIEIESSRPRLIDFGPDSVA